MAHLLGALLGVLTLVGTPSHHVEAQSPRRAARRARVAPARQAVSDSVAVASTLRAGSVVRPDTVAVGDPFTFVVTLEVPANVTVQWPSITDTAAAVAMRGPVTVTTESLGALRRETAEYALTAWNVGTLPIGMPNAIVRAPDGVRSVSLADARIVVRTVLPLDTSLHVPKPPRGLFPRVVPWWQAWGPAVAVIAALALLWWLWRRRRRRVVRRPSAPLDVFGRAMHEFERLQRLELAGAGERGRAVVLAADIVRTYLAERVSDAALSRTSAELLVGISDDPRIPRDRLASCLAEADRSRFVEFGEHLSMCERRAVAAERGAMDRYVVAFMAQHVGATFAGRITSVTRFGLFAALDGTGADGLIPIRSLGQEFFRHDEGRQLLIGERTGETFGLGDRVKLKLVEADAATAGLLFEIVDVIERVERHALSRGPGGGPGGGPPRRPVAHRGPHRDKRSRRRK